jgi:hypothetical protein
MSSCEFRLTLNNSAIQNCTQEELMGDLRRLTAEKLARQIMKKAPEYFNVAFEEDSLEFRSDKTFSFVQRNSRLNEALNKRFNTNYSFSPEDLEKIKDLIVIRLRTFNGRVRSLDIDFKNPRALDATLTLGNP